MVADPARLSEWVPTACLAQPVGAHEVRLEGEAQVTGTR
jgi:hypothetical protein